MASGTFPGGVQHSTDSDRIFASRRFQHRLEIQLPPPLQIASIFGKEGLCPTEIRPFIFTHRESRYSIERAAGVLGIRSSQCLCVFNSDENGRTDPKALGKLRQSLKKGNIPVIAAVASACATRTGSFNPISKIEDLCDG
ncbi:pyridoxal-dependent decarboxylase [Rhizobium leguminosarum]|uniref:pyridoxal-dependent decarboxylase n=1 Tax=Rhizobium leguminosarum TaxID=384 RepID=UPI003D788CF0